MRALLLVMALVAGCSSGSTPKNDAGVGICPANPQFCGGTCCGTECTQTDVDKNNCGACGNVCDSGSVCTKGKCGCLNAGTGNLQTDAKNCGACGHACGEGETCAGGQCLCGGIMCTGTQVCCNGTCSGTCSVPDMSMGSLPPCDCSGLQTILGSKCPLSGMCVAQDCCYEDTQGIPGLGPCDATPTTCSPSNM